MIPREKEGLIITLFRKTELRQALDRNSHWLKFQGNTELCIIYSASFENVNLFQDIWHIREQCEHNSNFIFAYAGIYQWETLHEHRKLHAAEPRHTGIHNTSKKKKSRTTFLTKKKFYPYTKTKQKSPHPAEVVHVTLVVDDVVVSHVTTTSKAFRYQAAPWVQMRKLQSNFQ